MVRAVEPLPEGRRIALEAVRLDGGDAAAALAAGAAATKGDALAIATGDTVRVRALVRPPMPPAYPGAWDLQRDAFFSGLGGSGYALGPVERDRRSAAERPAAAGAAAARDDRAAHRRR